MVMMLKIGRVDRFPTAAHLASYAGQVPRVHSSGGHDLAPLILRRLDNSLTHSAPVGHVRNVAAETGMNSGLLTAV
jgi:transposase